MKQTRFTYAAQLTRNIQIHQRTREYILCVRRNIYVWWR